MFDIKDDWIKLVIIAGPLLASSIAILFDVGFFLGVGVDFFTFFSLSEHLVFALQAIPFALPIALSVMGFIGGIWWGHQKTSQDVKDAVAKATAMTAEERQAFVDQLKKKDAVFKRYDPWVQFVIAMFGVWQLSLHAYSTAAFIFISQIVIKIIIPTERLQSKKVRVGLGLIFVCTGWLLAFLLGMERARSILDSKVPSERIFLDTGEVPANVIRAGERGVLYFGQQAKKLSFVKWDQIKKIERF